MRRLRVAAFLLVVAVVLGLVGGWDDAAALAVLLGLVGLTYSTYRRHRHFERDVERRNEERYVESHRERGGAGKDWRG